MERLPQLIQFTNLTHFSLYSYNLPRGFNERYTTYSEPFTSLLRSSPNLESFILSFEGEGEPYFPTPVLEALDNQFILPRLHTFHILGDADPDWIGFISKRTHPLRAFLARHPTIQDLKIGCPMDDISSDGMDPDELSCILLSVTHLACPVFLCEAVVTSKLARQLKSLAISNPHLGDLDDNPFDFIVQKMTGNALPNLRKLSIWDELCYYSLEVRFLQAFFLAAKGLEELEFRIGVDDYDGFLFVLGQAKNLRRIKIAYDQFRDSEDSWESFVM
ncbi:unnamed protein product [Rhizoctonia solani]|uniref:F-box domain-containing protein n=1 Tax=Rhizoctonia solani TaxID=456999 RepID=A0A8H3HP06_9AGAM|nr:unnamed protein product [Rhizoctonia solani]